MKVVTTFHLPSSVVSSVKCRLASRDLEHLVVAKLNRVDVYSLQPRGMQHECGVDVWGKVLCVKAIPFGKDRSKLAVMIAHPDPEVIFFSYEDSADGRKELVVNHSLSLYERISRPAEFFNDLLIHPSGSLAVAHCYTGRLKIIQLKAGDYDGDFDFALSECNVLSMAFIPTGDKEYSITILHLDALQRIQLVARDISPDGSEWEISSLPSTILQPTVISNKIITSPTEIVPCLIPVPPADQDKNDEDDEDEDEDEDEDLAFLGGVLVAGGRKLLLYELASDEGRVKQQGKTARLEKMKKDSDPTKAKAAKAKQNERDAKKRKPTASVDWPCSNVTAWCDVEGAPLRFFIGDAFGALSLLSLDNVRNIGLLLIPLGIASPPTSLTYLTNQALYLGSHLGDSQLIAILPIPSTTADQQILKMPLGIQTVSRTSSIPLSNKKGKQKADADSMEVDGSEETGLSGGRIIHPDASYIKVVESFKNIGPIIDAVMVDTEGSGQKQLVTCSGGQNTGALNIVRNGSEFQELALIPGIVNITGIWAVKPHFETSDHTHIVASTNSQTLLYRFKDAGTETSLFQISDGTARDLITKQATLALANVAKRTTERGSQKYGDSKMVVQVVPSGVYLLEYDSVLNGFTERARYLPEDVPLYQKPSEVTAASVNSSQVAVAFNGGSLAVLNIKDGMDEFQLVAHRHDAREVSAISCMPANPEKEFATLISISYWTTNEVQIMAINNGILESVVKSQPLPSLVRSVQLFNFGADLGMKSSNYHAYLICGLSDGSFVHSVFNPKDRQLLDQKIVSLGNAPVNLTVCTVEGKKAIFAAGNRATVISFDKKKIVHSPVITKDLTAVCRFNTQTFSNNLILAGPQGLHIGRVQDLNKLNIRTLSLGYANPQRIEYIPLLRKFAVACNISEPRRVGDYEPINSVLRLYDDTSFSAISEFKCPANEQITSVTNFTRKADEKDVAYICVGSVVYPDEDHIPVQGRLRIFTTVTLGSRNPGTELALVTTTGVVGCVYVVKYVNAKLVVTAEAAVHLYSFVSDATYPLSFTLALVTTWYNNYIVSSLGSFGDRIVTGDQISTVSLIKVLENKFECEARDFGPLCPVAVEALDQKQLITANNTMNLFTFSLGKRSDRNTLERDGGYHVADFVTKFIRGSISSDAIGGALLSSEAVFCTSSGRIGVVVNVDDQDLALELSSLQRNLALHIPGVGGGGHSKFRAPRESFGRSDGESAAFGFLDGDFLETFLSIVGNQKQVDKVYAGSSEPETLTFPLENYRRVLEKLQSLH